jgi:DNA-directed RNA polymerase specialized sigma24 family protein
MAESRTVQTAVRRFRAAQERLEAAQARFAAERRQVVEELVAAGLSYSQVAGIVGLSKQRVGQIIHGA